MACMPKVVIMSAHEYFYHLAGQKLIYCHRGVQQAEALSSGSPLEESGAAQLGLCLPLRPPSSAPVGTWA